MRIPAPQIVSDALVWLTGYHAEPPEWIVVEATNHCSRSCPVCGAAQARSQARRGYMDWEMFLALADEAARLRPNRVCLHAHGEPLLHPRVVDMIAELTARRLRSQIVTNGDRLDETLARRLREAGLTELIVSHPGASPGGYLICRGEVLSPADEERLTSALRVWEGSGRGVMVRCLVVPETVSDAGHGLGRFVERWLTVPGVQRVEFSTYQPWPRHVREDLLLAIFAKRRPCAHLRDGLNVLWDGTVTACPFDVSGELRLGHFPALRLGQAFNSPELRALRLSHRRGGEQLPGACRPCLVPRSASPIRTVLAEDLPPVFDSDQRRRVWFDGVGQKVWKILTADGGTRMAAASAAKMGAAETTATGAGEQGETSR